MGSKPIGRRLLLTLGAAALVGACAPAKAHPQWRAGAASPSGPSGPSGSPLADGPAGTGGGGASPSASDSVAPSVEPSWQPPVVARPTPGVCPTIPGIVQKPGGTQFYLPCDGTNIALTIDDGPDPTYTPLVLALLAQFQVKATFCMVGFRAEAHPGLVKAAIDGGHHVANHTFSHSLNLRSFAAPQVKGEIARATDVLTRASGGHPPTLFRAPGGAMSAIIAAECAAQGLRPVNWSVDPRDWSEPGVQQIVTVILTKTRPGSIILDHDGGGNRQQTVDALRIALPRLLDAGYTFTQV